MAGFVLAIHVFLSCGVKTWMPATSAGMTTEMFFINTSFTIVAPLPYFRAANSARGKKSSQIINLKN
jgi:hypothetical protein